MRYCAKIQESALYRYVQVDDENVLVGERDHDQRQKCWDAIAHVRPVDLGGAVGKEQSQIMILYEEIFLNRLLDHQRSDL
jgi:hypothetical protein